MFNNIFSRLNNGGVSSYFASPVATIEQREEFVTEPVLADAIRQRHSYQFTRNRIYKINYSSVFKRRAGIAPLIGHLKYDPRMLENYLWGRVSGTVHAMLAATAWNLKKLMKELLHILMRISSEPLLINLLRKKRFVKKRLIRFFLERLAFVCTFLLTDDLKAAAIAKIAFFLADIDAGLFFHILHCFLADSGPSIRHLKTSFTLRRYSYSGPRINGPGGVEKIDGS